MIPGNKTALPVNASVRCKELIVKIKGRMAPEGSCEITGIRLAFAGTKASCNVRRPPPSCLMQHIRRIRRFLDGSKCDLSDIPVSFKGFTRFRKRVTEAAQRIPWGTTVSYAGLARMAGVPSAVRAVASVMRRNPYPLVVPCHRVIRSDGAIGGFAGNTSGKRIEQKRLLLRLEGIEVD